MSLHGIYCNRCGKQFKSQSSLLNHQSQPLSKCLELYNIMLQAQEPLTSQPESQAQGFSAASSFALSPSPPVPSPPLSPIWPADTEMMDVANDQSSTEGDTASAPSSPFYSVPFPGASQTFGKAETFMGIFDKDDYADERNSNLYYPFATQQEWKLASFLLKSGLSMVQTDEFLRLELVSVKYCLKLF
jgi:hypothetical protein